jgi:hypothetical protein
VNFLLPNGDAVTSPPVKPHDGTVMQAPSMRPSHWGHGQRVSIGMIDHPTNPRSVPLQQIGNGFIT